MEVKVRRLIFDLLESQKHVVISTVNMTGNPESSLVGFGQNKKLELIFGTDITTRKVRNLEMNNNISAVVSGPVSAMQYEGTASLIKGEELKKFQTIFFKKIPGLRKYSLLKNQIYFKVKPNWIRFIDHTTSPGTITEIKL